MRDQWVRRRWNDFRQGHSIYLIFLLSFSNFILISYRLLIEQIEFLGDFFSSLWIFVVIFVIAYIPIAIFIGLWHRRTQISVETDLIMRNNPFMARNFRILVDMLEGKANKDDGRSRRGPHDYCRKLYEHGGLHDYRGHAGSASDLSPTPR